MTTIQLKTKVLQMEAQIKVMKVALGSRPDFGADDKVWKSIRPTVRKIRKGVFRETYGKK